MNIFLKTDERNLILVTKSASTDTVDALFVTVCEYVQQNFDDFNRFSLAFVTVLQNFEDCNKISPKSLKSVGKISMF